MIYLDLFLSFLKIGVVSFGGGYGMLSIIRETVISNGWLTEEQVLDFVAVSESTPGPIAINMATFVGSSQGGLLGAFCTTFGVILPAFLIIFLIASVLNNLLKYKSVQGVLAGIRPCVVGLILGTAVIMFLKVILNLTVVGDAVSFNWRGLIVFAVIAAVRIIADKKFKIKLSPIVLILISAAMGILLF